MSHSEEPQTLREARSPFDGSCDHRDIRTFYASELSYLKAMRKRYSCQFCATAAGSCPSCASTDKRIAELEKATLRA